MATYVKLGDKAESFYDPYSGLTLAGKEVVKLSPIAVSSFAVQNALKGGHLSHASEPEFIKAGGVVEKAPDVEEKKDDDPDTIVSDFGSNAEELIQYYKDNYEVKKKDIDDFKKLSLQEMVDELTKLAQE